MPLLDLFIMGSPVCVCVCLDLNSVEEELGTVLRNAMNSTLYSRSQSKSNRYMQYRVSPIPLSPLFFL